jgi:hypothetical protein
MMGAMDSKAASSTPTLFDLPHSVFKQVLQLLRRETHKRKRLELQQKNALHWILPSLPIGRPSPFVKQQLRVLLPLSRKRSRDQPLLLKKALQPDSLMLRKNKYTNSCSNISQILILAYRECFQSRLLEH